jgi:hypothetical protein
MLTAIVTTGFAANCSSSGPGGGNCSPALGSCDAPSPQMNPLDQQRGCLAARVVLAAVCDTSVNRCAPSGGLGPVCAFAPDGGVFIAILSDNDMLTAKGWRFSQPVMSFPNPAAIPLDQLATGTEEDECARALCAPSCSGVEPLAYGFCSPDGGDAGGG